MKRIIIISVICIFILAPMSAWLVVTMKPDYQIPNKEVTPATKAELSAAIDKNSQALPESQRYYTVRDIVSFEQIEKWWYLLKVSVYNTGQEDGGTSEMFMLVVKFKNSPESIKVVVHPGDSLYYTNISGGLGVPYDVIDKLNKAIGG